MNIRPRAGETLDSDNPELPLTQARFATPKSCHGDARARARSRRPSHNRRTLEPCPYAAAGRRFSVPAVPCRWTATPRPALPPTRAPGAPGTASRANTAGRSPGPSWTCCRRCCGASTTAAPAVCFPSYERIAEAAECARSTVAEALKALEWAGVLTWQNRITRIQVRERDLFGHWASRWRVIRTSNAYVFSDPKPQPAAAFACKSENLPGTPNQELNLLRPASAPDPNNPLERALQRLGAGIEERLLLNRSSGTV